MGLSNPHHSPLRLLSYSSLKYGKSYFCRIVKKKKTCKTTGMKTGPATIDNNMRCDKKKRERFNFPYTIEFLNPHNDNEIIRGIAMNISVSGICLYIPQPLNKGQEITIKSVVYCCPKTATVCWSEKYDDVYYKIGCYLQSGCYSILAKE